MRLAFPDGGHEDFAVGKGSFSIGSTGQDDIVIGSEVSGHAILTVDQRGITLSVDDLQADPIEVNERPVKRRAILRLGDRINIGGTLMVLRGVDLNTATPPHPFEACSVEGEPARVVLRGLSGRHAGQVFPVTDTILVGSGEDADIRVDADPSFQLAIGCAGDQLYLRHEAGPEALDVNGHAVRHARVSPGDQLSIGGERLLVEAPGFVPGKAYIQEPSAGQRAGNTQVFQAISAADANAAPATGDAGRDGRGNRRRDREPSAADGGGLDGEALESTSGRWDTIIISVCAVLSLAMLAWLYLSL